MLRDEPLPTIVREAWEAGRKIDLSGVGYGRLHWGNKTDVLDKPSPYYYFLAGLVQRHGFTRILEIGTHWGGATRAMWHGIKSTENAALVTIDITTESDNRLLDYAKITKIVGDGNSKDVFAQVLTKFGGEPVDLVYIDAEHQTVPTVMSYALYSSILRPKLVVFDDITLSEPMRLAWSIIKGNVPNEDTINAADVVRQIRPSPDNPGFGLVRLSKNL